eukprot:TRINITY_DN45941_c0_g1_i1.p1 TRINITY_DN45941_c0_g1~~TRINITY_DN45941_c0_g1_i1.p1  ORF type:complete len:366 (+),score=85.19 TRINITY_DN45941_c0_g1_i1:53-1099(+)
MRPPSAGPRQRAHAAAESPPEDAVVPKPAARPPTTYCGIPAARLVLPLLTLQNAGAVLLMRAARSLEGHSAFNTQTAVIMQELCKCLMCILLVAGGEPEGLRSLWRLPGEALRTAVPAFLYLGQNNLQYAAAGALDAATYTASYQSKIIWTGVLSVVILRRRLCQREWIALFLMAAGVACANLGSGSRTELAARAEVSAAQRAGGLAAVLAAACLSALAGVYFEKLLKGAAAGLWVRNTHLALYSIVSGTAVLSFSPSATADWFHGYTWLTWVCIAWNALGGLLVGAVIREADSVAKDLSLGASIALSTAGSVVLLQYRLGPLAAVGIAMVVYSVLLYRGHLVPGALR